jgi:hypothetical protein
MHNITGDAFFIKNTTKPPIKRCSTIGTDMAPGHCLGCKA